MLEARAGEVLRAHRGGRPRQFPAVDEILGYLGTKGADVRHAGFHFSYPPSEVGVSFAGREGRANVSTISADPGPDSYRDCDGGGPDSVLAGRRVYSA